MAGSPGFSFSHSVDSVTDNLDVLLRGAAPEVVKAVAEMASQLRDRDTDVEDFLTQTLSGVKGKEVSFTAATGGATVTFGISFSRVPTVFVTMVSPGGYTANVVNASTTTTGFEVQVYLGAVEQAAGTFVINWLAMG